MRHLSEVPSAMSHASNDGTIAYAGVLDERVEPRVYRLFLYSLKSEQDVFFVDCKPSYPYRVALALSSDGESLAVVVSVPDPSIVDTRSLHRLLVYDTKTRRVRYSVDGVDPSTPCWYHGSSRLAFVRQMSELDLLQYSGIVASPGTLVPNGLHSVLCVLDCDTGAVSVLQCGAQPLVAPDGSKVWVSWGKELVCVDGTSGAILARDVNVPGMLEAGLGIVLDDDRIIYEGLATKGVGGVVNAIGRWTPARRWSIKVAQLETMRFASIVPTFGPGLVRYWKSGVKQ
ncbi:MAG: hypothetical protein NTY35_12190 [Planctomycetota bacterium]|nr:hypothetical protein [Planctomycetota bacterium]